ncbi:MAG: hypothetical protein IPM98_19685 [Lewinellaceae bacterium]|nr:hypothetical protein [Lewinellaceae bacterium]
MEERQQTGCLGGTMATIAVVVVPEGKVLMFGVVCLVVFVVGIVQPHKIYDADFFLVADNVVGKMMEKCTHLEDVLHSLTCWRTGRQNLKGKEDGQNFLHRRGKVIDWGFVQVMFFPG